MPSDNTISFILREETIDLSFGKGLNLSPTTTLLNYLRQLPDRKGTKEGCAEGDCGACTVVIGELMPGKKIKYTAIDSCLVFLPMIHGKWIITVEDLKNNKLTDAERKLSATEHETDTENLSLLHPVQKAMVLNHGAQCGFCTPGIVMSLFGLFKNNPNPAKNVIEDALTGNLCRCTGYRPIIEAAGKSCSLSARDKFNSIEKKIIPMLISLNKNTKPLNFSTGSQKYTKVFQLNDALKLRVKFPNATLLSGATDIALKVTKKFETLPEVIDISEVKEIKPIKRYNNRIEIGAGVTLSELKRWLEIYFQPIRVRGKGRKGEEEKMRSWENEFSALYNQLCVFGSLQIRNLATLGGNIGTSSPISDLLPVLMAYGTDVLLVRKNKSRKIKLENFVTGYRKTDLKPGEIITKVILPFSGKNINVFSSKVSTRKNLDIATVNAGFRLKLNNKKIIEDIALFYGGMAAWTKRAPETENFLRGKIWNKENVIQAMDYISKDFTPITDARASAEFRIMIAKNLLLSCFTTVPSNM